jgi:protein-S-isoprenylcysteine O-methyltransferase Ste14
MVTVTLIGQTVLFPSYTAALVFNLVLILWILSEIIGAVIIPNIRRKRAEIERRDRSSVFILLISIFLSITISYYFAGNHIAMLPSWVYYLGIILMLSGIFLRQWSIYVLGRFFSNVVGIQKDHKVVENGPYAYVRHPSYTGVLLILVGIGLAVQSWGATITLIAIFTVAYGYRIIVEEKALISKLGNDYINYSKRTKRIIPYVI